MRIMRMHLRAGLNKGGAWDPPALAVPLAAAFEPCICSLRARGNMHIHNRALIGDIRHTTYDTLFFHGHLTSFKHFEDFVLFFDCLLCRARYLLGSARSSFGAVYLAKTSVQSLEASGKPDIHQKQSRRNDGNCFFNRSTFVSTA